MPHRPPPITLPSDLHVTPPPRVGCVTAPLPTSGACATLNGLLVAEGSHESGRLWKLLLGEKDHDTALALEADKGAAMREARRSARHGEARGARRDARRARRDARGAGRDRKGVG